MNKWEYLTFILFGIQRQKKATSGDVVVMKIQSVEMLKIAQTSSAILMTFVYVKHQNLRILRILNVVSD